MKKLSKAKNKERSLDGKYAKGKELLRLY